jgi:hypothetical protein
VLLSLKPMFERLDQADAVQAVNRRYAALAEADPAVVSIDLWTPLLAADGTPDPRWLDTDRHHPSREGYRRIAALVRPWLTGGERDQRDGDVACSGPQRCDHAGPARNPAPIHRSEPFRRGEDRKAASTVVAGSPVPAAYLRPPAREPLVCPS